MAAPTTAARVKKTLANPEPSTHGPTLPTCALQQVVGYLGYTGRDANVDAKAARDPGCVRFYTAWTHRRHQSDRETFKIHSAIGS